MHARCLPLIAALLWGVARPAPTQAQDAGVEDGRLGARAEFVLGEQSFAASRYEEALRHFERAFELAPNDSVLYNIGVCLESLGRYREAIEKYEACALSPSLDAAERARARAAAAAAREQLGALVVEGAVSGASVEIDGTSVCTVPCRVALDPGSRSIVVRGDGNEVRESVTIVRGRVATVRVEAGGGRAARPRAAAAPSIARPARRTRTRSAVPRERADERGGLQPGVLTYVGAGVAALGITGIVVFGLRAESLHAMNEPMPTRETYDEGVLMRDLANVSIGVAIAGAILVAVDLLLLQDSD